MAHLLYLADSYQFTATAVVQSVEENEHGTLLILDQTIFYPQGGGQPCDTGIIVIGDVTFTVNNVRLSPEGVVYHYGVFDQPGVADVSGETVQLSVDEERRMLNARVHSAGHLIDIAVKKIGITGIVPTKGFHNPEGSYVEYDGVLEDAAQYIRSLETAANQLVADDIPIITEDLSPAEAQARGVYAPPGKSARFVYFDGYESDGCGCGGTHVRSTAEIGKITIRKIKSKKGVTRVSYAVE